MKWRWLVRLMPRRTRIELLEALAWPEFTVTRSWLVSVPATPGGLRVDQIPLADVLAEEEASSAILGLNPLA